MGWGAAGLAIASMFASALAGKSRKTSPKSSGKFYIQYLYILSILVLFFTHRGLALCSAASLLNTRACQGFHSALSPLCGRLSNLDAATNCESIVNLDASTNQNKPKVVSHVLQLKLC